RGKNAGGAERRRAAANGGRRGGGGGPLSRRSVSAPCSTASPTAEKIATGLDKNAFIEGAPRTAEEFSSSRGVITGLLLTASLTAAWDFRMTASAWGCTKHLSKGRPPGPEGHGDCGAVAPRPRNSSVPPRRPFKTRGSS